MLVESGFGYSMLPEFALRAPSRVFIETFLALRGGAGAHAGARHSEDRVSTSADAINRQLFWKRRFAREFER